jgi:hypothetical protein
MAGILAHPADLPQPIGFGLNDTVAVAEVEAPDAVLTQLVDL